VTIIFSQPERVLWRKQNKEKLMAGTNQVADE
jgi:hypothetical protein